MSSTIIVAGMHRSGTSYTASLLEAAGVFMGAAYHPTDEFNVRGYFEDVEFLDLQRRMLRAACGQQDQQYADWGWCESEQLDVLAYEPFQPQVDALLARCGGGHPLWGWKDPRTTLLLDFWAARLSDAKFVLVFRPPWEVADSIRRLDAQVFRDHPDWALKIWGFYNRKLIDFYVRNQERCVLVAWAQIRSDGCSFVRYLAEKFRLPLLMDERRCSALFDPQLPHSPAPAPDFFDRHPRARATWQELQGLARAEWARRPLPKTRVCAGQPRVAVVIPCYNQGEFLFDALHSVVAAAGEQHETIIIDDGSTDAATIAALEAAKAQGWRVVHQTNQGLSQARNRGIQETSADYILPLDVDNCIGRDFMSDAISLLDAESEIGVVYGDPELFGLQTGRREVGDFDLNRLAVSNYIDACAIFRREVWRAVGGYDPEIKFGHEDWDFWLGAAARGFGFRYLPRVTFRYRVREYSLLSEGQKPENFARVTAHMSAKHGYYRDHYPAVIGALNSRYVVELHARRRLEAQLAEAGWSGSAARLSELERHAESLKVARDEAERYALSLHETLEAVRRSHAEATAYARSLEKRSPGLAERLGSSRLLALPAWLRQRYEAPLRRALGRAGRSR